MIEYEAVGRTLEEAVGKALIELGIKRDNAVIDIKEEPSQGLLGLIGGKNARVIVKAENEPGDYIKILMGRILQEMNIEGSVNVEEDDEKVSVSIYGDDVGALIGRRGKTLSDTQYLLNVIMRRQFNKSNKIVLLDVENYRSRREKTLTQLAHNVAKRVRAEQQEKVLEPMTPQERRIVHIALQEFPGVTTHSSGDEPQRKVIIAPS